MVPTAVFVKEDEDGQYRDLLDSAIADTLKQAIRVLTHDPQLALTGIRILRYQKKAAAIRRKEAGNGLLVPPSMFVSITSRCNLTCRGCYMRGLQTSSFHEMDPARLRSLVEEAFALGVSVIVLAGGEPLMRKEEIMGITRDFPRILFPVFTNGLLIDDKTARELSATKNVVPVISVEGFQQETDSRRGAGVHDRILSAFALMKNSGIFFGCSVTVTRENVDCAVSDRFVQEMIAAGARAFVYVEYVPVDPATEDLVLGKEQQREMGERISALNAMYPAIFIGFPGDEKTFGGCLAAGRGFVHIAPAGDLEACPAAPFSDKNLARLSLRDALSSPLLLKIRSNHHLLIETSGGCALWRNREWVRTLNES